MTGCLVGNLFSMISEKLFSLSSRNLMLAEKNITKLMSSFKLQKKKKKNSGINNYLEITFPLPFLPFEL